MNKKLNCIMLVDDDHDDNFFHERSIKQHNSETIVIMKNKAKDALEYLQSNKDIAALPDLIFLDINMPGMNGWEFLQEYSLLDKQLQSKVIIMLTTSDNPDDVTRAKARSVVAEYITKPLTKEIMCEITEKYFTNPKAEAIY